jgi:DNA-binding transcriptional LysR family regulator
MDWSRWQKANPSVSQHQAKWLTVETRAQALDAVIAGAGIALMDMAYLRPHLDAGRVDMMAERPLQLPTGYYFVHARDARSLHLLALFRDWVVEAAKPFRRGES